MARTELTQVDYADLIKIAEHYGLNVEKNKGFTKCYAQGKDRPPALGIPNTAQVTRVELVGFEHQLGVAHPKPPAKTVTQMLDFSKANVADILHDFMVVAGFVANSGGTHAVETAEEALARAEAERAAKIAEFEAAYQAERDEEPVAAVG